MIFPLTNLEAFCARLRIPAKDHSGVFRMAALYSTQRYFLTEVAAGLERDVHDFLVLKGRQQGITTITDALDLYWPQKYDGIQGMMVADDDDNRKVRRDILRTMFYSLTGTEFQKPVRADNDEMLAWDNGSRLMYGAAKSREQGAKTKLGRGRGLSYLHADEFDAWPNPRAVMALRQSRSQRHPNRLYTWASTAQGHGVLKDAWKEHEHSPTTRRIFIPSWRHDLNRVERDKRAIWDVYGQDRLTEDEKLWIGTIKTRYAYEIPPEYVVWYRWTLAEDMHGDEAMMCQEHPNVEEEAFQSFGDKFFRPALIRTLRDHLTSAPAPTAYAFTWDRWLDTTKLDRCAPETKDCVTVWEDPDPEGVYITACHPAFSSAPGNPDDVVQVWRAYPDQLVQAAEWVVKGGDLTARCAWAVMILGGLYKMSRPIADLYLVMDMEATGYAVSQEIQRIETRGASIAPRSLQGKREFQNVIGAVRHYLFRRPDSFSSGFAKEWKSQSSFRPWVLNQLRDAVENGTVTIHSELLIEELAGVRRGEHDDADVIAAGSGGETSECRVLAMAMAVEYWLDQVQQEIEGRFPTKAAPQQDRHVGEVMVGQFLHRIQSAGRTK